MKNLVHSHQRGRLFRLSSMMIKNRSFCDVFVAEIPWRESKRLLREYYLIFRLCPSYVPHPPLLKESHGFRVNGYLGSSRSVL